MTRTSEPLPLIVGPGETLRLDRLEDDATDRPAVIVVNGTVEIGVALRQPTGVNARDTDPGIGRWFPGTKRDVSKHDVARAMIVAVGTCKVKVNSLTSDVGILAIAEDDGTYGVGSSYTVGYSKCGFGVMLSGQTAPVVKVSTAVQLLYAQGPARHVVYMNESRCEGKYLRCLDPYVRIGSVTSKVMAPNPILDSCTFKSKGAWGLDVEIRKDRNFGASVDCFESCGVVTVLDQDNPTSTNPLFSGFRLGDRSGFGKPPAYLCIRGSFNSSGKVGLVHVLDGMVADAGLKVTGAVDVYGAAAHLFPSLPKEIER